MVKRTMDKEELWRAEPGVTEKNEQERLSQRGRSESIWGTYPTSWKENLHNAYSIGCQLQYKSVITLCLLFFLFLNGKHYFYYSNIYKKER